MRNRFMPRGMFGSLRTGSYGADIAEAAAVGAESAKILTPFDRPAQVNQGSEIFRSPVGGVQGQIAVPNSIETPEYLSITIDTRDEDADELIVPMFDAQALNGDCDCDSGTIGGQVWMGSPECNKYDALVRRLCSSKIMLASMRIQVQAYNGAAPTIDFPITIASANLKGDSNVRSFETGLFVSPDQFHQDRVDVPLSGRNALLDPNTTWKWRIPKDLKVKVTFFILAESNI